MVRVVCIAASAVLLLSPGVLQGAPRRSPALRNSSHESSDSGSAVLPDNGPTRGSLGSQNTAASAEIPLTEKAKLEIIRYVSGEFARALEPLPADKKGFHLQAGEPLNHKALQDAIVNSGAAVNAGDTVQITRIEFRHDAIVFEVNGGPRGHSSWRDRIHFSMGGYSPVVTSTTTTQDNRVQVAPPKGGAMVYLDFGRSLPNMSADQLKAYLGRVFDFSKQSAAVVWTSTLPPKVRKAIANKRAAVGMDHEEVLAAMGRPDQKVREREPDGTETEDWIYGQPPTRTVFVLFAGEKVIRIDSYP